MIDFYFAILVAQKARHCLPLFLSIANQDIGIVRNGIK